MASRNDFGIALCAAIVLALCASLISGAAITGDVSDGDPHRGDSSGAVADTVAHRGWAPSMGEAKTARSQPPLFPMLAALVHRGSAPDVGWLMTPEDERQPAVDPGIDEQFAIDRSVFQTVQGLVLLICLLGALALVEWARGYGRKGLVFALPLTIVLGAFPPQAFHIRGRMDEGLLLAAALIALATWLTLRSLRDRALAQPFLSSARGALVGLALGLAVASWVGSMLFVLALQLAIALRMLRQYRDPSGALRTARGLPVFATSIHKAALLVLLPFTIHSPHTMGTPWDTEVLSWFQMSWLAVGWIFFAPYALIPRRATARPLLAAAPALVLTALLGVAIGGLPQIASDPVRVAVTLWLRGLTVLVAALGAVGAFRLARTDPRALLPFAYVLVLGAAAAAYPELLPVLSLAAAFALLATLLSLWGPRAAVEDPTAAG